MLVGILGVCVVAWLTANVFLSLAYYPGWYFHNRVLMALVGMVAGLGGAALLFYFINVTIESLPQRLSQGLIPYAFVLPAFGLIGDRKSTRLNSSHVKNSYAVFCLKKTPSGSLRRVGRFPLYYRRGTAAPRAV